MADDVPAITVVVSDTSPLITLASAQTLDYLLYLGLPIVIPDGVFYEATADSAKLGADVIREWVLTHHEHVRIAPTSIFTAARASAQRVKSLGELAAVEAVQDLDLPQGARAILMFEDARAARTLIPDNQIIAISTRDLLVALAAEGLIPSVDAVFQRAREAGRHPAELDLLGHLSPNERAAFDAVIKTARPFGVIGEATGAKP